MSGLTFRTPDGEVYQIWEPRRSRGFAPRNRSGERPPYHPVEIAKRTLAEIRTVKRQLFAQGKLLIVKNTYAYPAKTPPVGRGIIREFSDASRFRLLKKIACIDWTKLTHGMFITLTYPDEVVNVDLKTATMQRHHFIRYMEKSLQAKVPILWRKEQQVRKSGRYVGYRVQHWHLSVFTRSPIWCAEINDWWRRTVGWKWEIQAHRRYLDSAEHAAFYLAKYLTKDEPYSILDYPSYLTNPGRAWGWHRWNMIPLHPVESIIGFTDQQWDEILRITRRHKGTEQAQAQASFTMLGPRAADAAKKIFDFLS